VTGDTILAACFGDETHGGVALIPNPADCRQCKNPVARLQNFQEAIRSTNRGRHRVVARHGRKLWGTQCDHSRARFRASPQACLDLKGRKPFGGHILSHDSWKRPDAAGRLGPFSDDRNIGWQLRECPPSDVGLRSARPPLVPGQPQHLAVCLARAALGFRGST